MLTSVPLAQYSEFTQQLVRTASLQILHRARYRQAGRDRHQQMHVIAIDRPGINDHLMRPCGLTQQFPAPNPNVATKDGIKYFVIRTTCYLQSQTVWLPRLYASI